MQTISQSKSYINPLLKIAMPMCLSYTRIYSPVFLITPLGTACIVTFQTSNYTKPLVYQRIIRSGLNIFLDWVMIFGNLGCPAMGISGAALATSIAEIAVGTIFVIVLACLFVFGFKFGISGVFIAVLTDEFVRCLINFGKYLSIRKLESRKQL